MTAQPHQPPSGMYNAATILLLVGAILQAVGALFFVGMGVFMGAVFDSVGEEVGRGPGWIVGGLYIAMGLLAAVGAVFGFLAHRDARRGDAHGAFVLGLVAALLPPVQLLLLLGAIFAKVSPEGEAASRLRGSGRPH